MELVRELLELMRGMKMSGVVVVVNFILLHVQPWRERADPGFDFKGDTNGTQERMKNLMKEAMLHRATELFAPNVLYIVPGQPKPFNCMNPPPQVNLDCCSWCFLFRANTEQWTDLLVERSIGRNERRTSRACRGAIGQK